MEVNIEYQALQALEDTGANTRHGNIISAHEDAAKDHIPVEKEVPWENDVVIEGVVKKAFEESMIKRSWKSTAKLENDTKELQEAYDLEQENYSREKVSYICNTAERQKSKLVWETVNEFTGRKGTSTGKIKAKSPDEWMSKWKDHFLNLLRQPMVITLKATTTTVEYMKGLTAKMIILDIELFAVRPFIYYQSTQMVTTEELVKCVRGFKNNKASGLDNIPIEVW